MKVFNKVFKNLRDYNIYPDIHGHGTEFFSLQKKLGGKAFSLGDICDRGLETKNILDYFMKYESLAIMGNHDHMMLDFFTEQKYYSPHHWIFTSGENTLKSFAPLDKRLELERLIWSFKDDAGALHRNEQSDSQVNALKILVSNKVKQIKEFMQPYVDKSYLDFLKSLPAFYRDEEVILSHAPIDPKLNLDLYSPFDLGQVEAKAARSFLWDRPRIELKKEIQIFGHLDLVKPKIYLTNAGVPFGLCLDGSKGKKLWCYKVNEDKMYSEEYL